MKRIRWEVRWSRARKCWTIYQGLEYFQGWCLKATAVHEAAFHCRKDLRNGTLSELIIKNRDGRIGKGSGSGSGSRRSYGHDPGKSRG
jgi:hypothetical protein